MNIGWDDLRYFLAIHEAGSVAAAARALGVSHVTVGRRLASLEESVGRLFERAEGYVLTPLGQRLLPGAESMRAGMASVRESLAGRSSVRVHVRVAIPEPLGEALLAGLEPFLAAHPELVLDLLTGARLVSLSRREADIALRIWRKGEVPGEADVVCKRLATLGWSVYGAPALVGRLGLGGPTPRCWESVPWIGYSSRAPFVPGRDWLDALPSAPKPILIASSMLTVLSAVERGLGVGIIPDLLARGRELAPLTEPVERVDAWIAMHPRSRDEPMMRCLREELERVVRSWA